MQNTIQTTTDYNLFKTMNGNRAINQKHLEKLIKSIEEKYLFTVIIVNENYEIIDGQHRYNALKQLGLPINYTIEHNATLFDVQRLNKVNKTWGANDYLDGYCDLGYHDYIILKKFMATYSFSFSECMALLLDSKPGGGLFEDFKFGKFKVKNLQESESKADKIMSLKKFYQGYNRRVFVYAMMTLFKNENFDFSEFYQKAKTNQGMFKNHTTEAANIEMIEEIYNYRRSKKVNLRF